MWSFHAIDVTHVSLVNAKRLHGCALKGFSKVCDLH